MAAQIGKKAPDFFYDADGWKWHDRVEESQREADRPLFLSQGRDVGMHEASLGFRDASHDFRKTGAVVIGVSRDSVASHDRFKRKYELPFVFASDADGRASSAYGTWVEKSMYGRKYMGMDRSTFLIDESGVLRAEWRKVKVPGHVEDVLKAAKSL